MDMDKIGNTITVLREKKGKSREEMAVDLGLSYSAIVSYELGKRIPKDTVKIKIAEYFDTTVEKIFFK